MVGIARITTKRDRIGTLMKNHSWLEVRYYSKGIYGGCKSAEWEFRSISTPYRAKAADRVLSHAEQLMAALSKENEGVPF